MTNNQLQPDAEQEKLFVLSAMLTSQKNYFLSHLEQCRSDQTSARSSAQSL